MHGTRWYSFKHNVWATVTDEPKTKNGYYTIEFDTGFFRRYNAARINAEVKEFNSINKQLEAQGIPAPKYPEISRSIPQKQAVGAAIVYQGSVTLPEANHTTVYNTDAVMETRGKVIGLVFE